MTTNRFNNYSSLGVGIGLRVPHYNHILTNTPPVEWFEIISENFLIDGGKPESVLESILEKYVVVMHGVSLYFGSPDELDWEHLRRLKALVRKTKTPWLTDHLCWGSIDGTYTHDLLPLPYTMTTAKVAAEKIRMVRDYLEVEISVENLSSYAEFSASTMTEWEFLSEVVEIADCGILLDVNNIYVSAQNHEFNPRLYVDSIPHERVAQIHIAGHSQYEHWIIDTHDRAPIDPVWDLYGYTIQRVGYTPTLLEWDSRVPSFEEVFTEARKAESWLRDSEHEQRRVESV
ncbi:MAG: DUF692 domain-containing protein [Bdellovibrionales bacterium]|nr:DUF692 domain-containing protein [Bdellovibrionales bacterium]